ncbi:MAG TPA: class IV adenylate cyclase [Bryobacteraceae bacterium]|jgi:predicted adenylyl cyclase CyaB
MKLMPENVEIKARLRDPARAEEIAARLSGGQGEVIRQEDVFFPCERARLKLRMLGPDSGEVIRYERPDLAAARSSRYVIARTPDPRNLLEILTETLGTAGTVKKTRRLFLVGQTRVHIDEVEGLGSFLELEVVLTPAQSESEGRRIAEQLLSEFAIGPEQLMAEAYVDLLRAAVSA